MFVLKRVVDSDGHVVRDPRGREASSEIIESLRKSQQVSAAGGGGRNRRKSTESGNVCRAACGTFGNRRSSGTPKRQPTVSCDPVPAERFARGMVQIFFFFTAGSFVLNLKTQPNHGGAQAYWWPPRSSHGRIPGGEGILEDSVVRFYATSILQYSIHSVSVVYLRNNGEKASTNAP